VAEHLPSMCEALGLIPTIREGGKEGGREGGKEGRKE
jgi:hypothetical protein